MAIKLNKIITKSIIWLHAKRNGCTFNPFQRLAWRCQPLERRMNKKLIILVIYLFSYLCCSDSSTGKAKVYDFLTGKYPELEVMHIDDLSFLKGTKIELIETPLLTSKKGIEIYKTILGTPYPEYYDLEIAVLQDLNKDITKIAHSPVFDNNQIEFNKLFLTTELINDTEKREFINELSLIFKEITYEGSVKNIIDSNDYWTAEIWHRHLKWRILEVKYDENRISNIKLTNPKEE